MLQWEGGTVCVGLCILTWRVYLPSLQTNMLKSVQKWGKYCLLLLTCMLTLCRVASLQENG